MKSIALNVSVLWTVFLCGELFAGVPPACVNWPAKPAWEWTFEERLNQRFDSKCFEARRIEAGLVNRRDGSCRSSGEIGDFVFGTDTPELLLPWELFQNLLGTAFLADEDFRSGKRKIFVQRAETLELPADFWEVIEKTANDYLALLRHQHALAAGLKTASPAERVALIKQIEESQKPNCGARAAALDRLNEAFPDQLFLKFLYTAVAPGLCVSGDPESQMNHRRIARACPPTE